MSVIGSNGKHHFLSLLNFLWDANALDDENKCRYASVVDDRLQIHYYHNGSETLNDYTGIRGCTMTLQFTVPSEK